MEEKGFVVLTPENLQEVAEKLDGKEGRILVATPGPRSYQGSIIDANLILFAHPLINLKGSSGPFLYTGRGTRKIKGSDWQTKWQDDRDYLLRQGPEISGGPLYEICRNLSDRLALGEYEFKIGFQFVGGMGPLIQKGTIPYKGITIYIGKNKHLRRAFRYGLMHIINQMEDKKKELLLKAVEQITDYAMADLRTDEIFRNNVSAGMEADCIYG